MVDLHPEQARVVLENLPVGVVLIDRNERVSWANAYASTLLETEIDGLLGQAVTSTSLPYSPPNTTDDAPEICVDGTMVGITQRYDHPSGQGSVVMVLERGHALVWFLSALSSGVSGSVAGFGVLSRGAISNRLEAEVSRSRRYANPLSCITVRFGGVPDHNALSEVARHVKGQLRWVDQLGQWNSDTLVVILPETDECAARALRDKLAATVKTALDATNDAVSAQLGAGSWQRGDNAEQLVCRALAAAINVPNAETVMQGG